MKTRVPSSMAALVLRVENTVIFCWMLFHLAKTVCVGPSLHFACFAQESSWKLWGAMRFPPEILLPLPPNSLLSEEEPGEKARRPPARPARVCRLRSGASLQGLAPRPPHRFPDPPGPTWSRRPWRALPAAGAAPGPPCAHTQAGRVVREGGRGPPRAPAANGRIMKFFVEEPCFIQIVIWVELSKAAFYLRFPDKPLFFLLPVSVSLLFS